MSFVVQLTDIVACELYEIHDFIDQHDSPGRTNHVPDQI